MTHTFNPVTTGEAIQVAILDELQKISGLLEQSAKPSEPELPADSARGEQADAPAEKPATTAAPAKKTAAKKTIRKTVTGR